MPILDETTSQEKSEGENVLREILGPATHGPLHADEMRAAARRVNAAETRRDAALANALGAIERARKAVANRLYSPM